MKKPKLYTSRPPAEKSSPPSRQSRFSPPPSNRQSLSSHPWLKSESAKTSSFDRVEILSRKLTEVTSQMEKWFNTFSRLTNDTQDRKAINDFIAALSKRKASTSRETGGSKGKSTSESPGSTISVGNGSNEDQSASGYPKPHSSDGDSLYDLINAPGMNKIVDHVMKNRQNRRRKR